MALWQAAELNFDVLTKSKSYHRQRVIVRVILHLLHLTNPEKETRNECLSHQKIFKVWIMVEMLSYCMIMRRM